jgi:hypothetical protein
MKRHRIFKNAYLQDISTFCIRYCKLILHQFNKNSSSEQDKNLKDSLVLKAVMIL